MAHSIKSRFVSFLLLPFILLPSLSALFARLFPRRRARYAFIRGKKGVRGSPRLHARRARSIMIGIRSRAHFTPRREITFISRDTTALMSIISVVSLPHSLGSLLFHGALPSRLWRASRSLAFRFFSLLMLAAPLLSAATIAGGTFCLDFMYRHFSSLHFNNVAQFESTYR